MMSMKNCTFRFVAQCLNQLRHRVPHSGVVLYYNLTGPPSYMLSVVVRNVFTRRMRVLACVLLCGRCSELSPTSSHIYFPLFLVLSQIAKVVHFNPLTPNDLYISRTAPTTSKRCILYIYSTNVGTEYFKHALYSPLFSLQNAVSFIMLTSLLPVLFTFYIQSVLKLKKK